MATTSVASGMFGGGVSLIAGAKHGCEWSSAESWQMHRAPAKPDVVTSTAALKADDDLAVVQDRLLAAILSGDPDQNNGCNVSGAHDFAKSLQSDGSWADVNYTVSPDTGL